ncbi:LURP-one-related/scramblase family protein [Halobacterium zhouii]|uniref:LURP-one-related/scramblase family protein n=1 Tax=Halobacterium zhouii TaxID=2902624 RepID=UPI001E53388B|nr:hypothetical protein [Halobacterium zhouii]
MADSGTYDISTLQLDDDRYEVTQSLVRNKYAARDSAGDVVLRGKQKMLKMKEQFPFETGDGDPAFTVKAGGILDVAGNYAIVDEGTGDEVVVLDKKFTLLRTRWRIRDPDTGDILATIKSKSKLYSLLKHFVDVLPPKYKIVDPDGDHVGRISGQFSLRDKYTVEIDDASDVPKEAVVAAAMVIDAIEGN